MLNETTSDTILKAAFTPEEKALVDRAIRGDQQAQFALYRKYVGAMFHTVIRMVGNREDAEDVTQEVFTKVFQRLGSFRGESTLGAWIKRVTVNTALNFMRKKKRIIFQELNERTNAIDEAEIDEAAWANDIRQIHEAIKKLPDGCRMVFNLYMLEGYKHAEVANMLGITESTSKTQFRRAKRLLKEIILT
ncbi:MAG: sigma-70 family RNA polymerase sigma factor [Bacteroidota bacterium]